MQWTNTPPTEAPRNSKWVETAPQEEGLYWAALKDSPAEGVLIARVILRNGKPRYSSFGYGGGDDEAYGDFDPACFLWIADPIATPNGAPVWRGFVSF